VLISQGVILSLLEYAAIGQYSSLARRTLLYRLGNRPPKVHFTHTMFSFGTFFMEFMFLVLMFQRWIYSIICEHDTNKCHVSVDQWTCTDTCWHLPHVTLKSLLYMQGRKLMVIATTSQKKLLKRLQILDAFSTVITASNLTSPDHIITALQQRDSFNSARLAEISDKIKQ